jgi:hypothetical protein
MQGSVSYVGSELGEEMQHGELEEIRDGIKDLVEKLDRMIADKAEGS